MTENELIVIYVTMSGKEISRDSKPWYIPRLKETVFFSKAAENLPEFVKYEPFNVQEIEYHFPHLIIVKVWHRNYN
jgi:hypothetical protein